LQFDWIVEKGMRFTVAFLQIFVADAAEFAYLRTY